MVKIGGDGAGHSGSWLRQEEMHRRNRRQWESSAWMYHLVLGGIYARGDFFFEFVRYNASHIIADQVYNSQ